ncbi:SAM-dependent methyltransferase [Longibacter salinarum]|uniref:SAM-dependent methyltransferase n=1 Tax=Longibacter salinarum TaxID=1850348 RepID=A0A2A8CUM7_9BACT|nr:class I SAM-dependent methyltransferase [Longibacter salinarum]PEN11228.1 SAM-dependent methyltransferase [Longibacter salinarum]
MSDAFDDHFSGHAADYARFRPTYPDALFDAITAPCRALDLVWDCGTGNGQAAIALARRAKRVIATDASAEQIKHALPHARVEYHVAPAANVSIADNTVDLVTVAQALHWFDLDRFYPEARRVLRPGGVIAVWTYSLFHVPEGDAEASAINPVLRRYYEDVVGPYWPPERRHIETGYQSLPFPFDEIEAPEVELRMDWTLAETVGYLRTWSASQRYRAEREADPIAEIEEDLRRAWGEADRVRTLRWPAPLRIGRT